MRVLFIGEVSGGEGTFVRNLVGHPPDGISYSCVFSDGTCTLKSVKRYTFCERFLNAFKSTAIGAGLTIKIIKTDEHYDLIHIHGIATKFVKKNVKSPIIFSASGNLWQGLLDFYNWNKLKFYRSYIGTKILYKVLNIVDRIHNNREIVKLVTWSEFVKNTYIKFGVPEEKIEVIYPGFPEPSNTVYQKSDTVNFLFIAGKGKFQRKGGNLVLKAFKELLNMYHNIYLFLVCNKQEVPPEYLRIDNIKHLGFLNLKKLYSSIYPRMNILVLPTYADGFPTVCAEVQGYGIPVITTNIWANPEIVLNNKTGILISPGDFKSLKNAMSILIEDEQLRVKFGRKARQHFLKKFSIDLMRYKYGLLYKSVVEGLS